MERLLPRTMGVFYYSGLAEIDILRPADNNVVGIM
jgi:hypothetical protein